MKSYFAYGPEVDMRAAIGIGFCNDRFIPEADVDCGHQPGAVGDLLDVRYQWASRL